MPSRRGALEIVASGKVRGAFEIEKEPQHIRTRYGEGACPDGTRPGRSLLLARRLVEAGVSVVTQCFSGWDTHRANFSSLRGMLPPLDQALYGLITDLDERGLLSDVAVLVGGEFGRTPRIGDLTPDGRGHWPEAGFLWVAGGWIEDGAGDRRDRRARRKNHRESDPNPERFGDPLPRPGHRPGDNAPRLRGQASVCARAPRSSRRADLTPRSKPQRVASPAPFPAVGLRARHQSRVRRSGTRMTPTTKTIRLDLPLRTIHQDDDRSTP
jgi:hypothetical protein